MMTKLEAVNQMLAAIRESPVASLDAGLEEAHDALTWLERLRLRVIAIGWHFNTDHEVVLVPDTEGRIRVPVDALRIDTTGTDRYLDLGQRRDATGVAALWDNTKGTFAIARSVKCRIVRDIAFESLPFEAQTYIATRAAREFQAKTLGSRSVDADLVRSEAEAQIAFQDAEAEAEDTNILTSNAHAKAGRWRNNRIWGT